MRIAYYLSYRNITISPISFVFVYLFFYVLVHNWNNVLFLHHNAPFKKKSFPGSSLPCLPRDKPCRVMVCQGFCQRDHERGLADAGVAGEEEVGVVGHGDQK